MWKYVDYIVQNYRALVLGYENGQMVTLFETPKNNGLIQSAFQKLNDV